MPFERKIKRKRTGRFYSDIRLRGADGKPTGERVRVLLPGCKNKSEARVAERSLEQKLRNPEEAAPKTLTFREFTRDHYRPHAEQHRKGYSFVRSVLNRLDDFFGDTPLKDISVLSIVRYTKRRAMEKTERGTLPKNSSLNTEVFSVLSAVMRLAHKGGLIRRNPCHDLSPLPEEPGDCPRLWPGDEEKLLAACAGGPEWLSPLVVFALGTGMRRAEMLALKWTDIDFQKRRAYLKTAKWAKDPRITKGAPLSSRVLEILAFLPRRSEYVFSTDRGRDVPGTTFHLAFTQACARAGMRFKIHWLRHEFGSRLGDRNTNPYRIARLMGHSNIKMSMRYVHADDEDLFSAVEGVFQENGHSAVTSQRHESRKTA